MLQSTYVQNIAEHQVCANKTVEAVLAIFHHKPYKSVGIAQLSCLVWRYEYFRFIAAVGPIIFSDVRRRP